MNDRPCARPGCGGVATHATGVDGSFYRLCDCCWELLLGWIRGEGEFRHGGWERRMIRENMQALDVIESMRSAGLKARLRRLIFGG